MGVPWSMAWDMSGDSSEDYDWCGITPRKAVIEDIQDWF